MFAFRTTTRSKNVPKHLWKFIVRGLAVLFALIAIAIIGADNGKDPIADMDTDILVLVGGIIPVGSLEYHTRRLSPPFSHYLPFSLFPARYNPPFNMWTNSGYSSLSP